MQKIIISSLLKKKKTERKRQEFHSEINIELIYISWNNISNIIPFIQLSFTLIFIKKNNNQEGLLIYIYIKSIISYENKFKSSGINRIIF